jgi:predicted aldo/keto reductase-like oxidoreductase
MIRYAIDHGVNYVDTAWSYHDGESEIVTGQALKNGYREKVMLATKNPTWLINKPEDWDYYLDEQLKKLQTEHIDFYLQHSLSADSWSRFKKFGIWNKVMDAKKAGKIKYFGFSFHDEYEVFSDILDTYDWDFCQIQFNYLDTDYQAGLKGLARAKSKNIGVIVMEPLRGGRLATGLPDDLVERMNAYPVKRSPVEWALRFVANQPAVSTVLSGMSTFEQVEDNLRICSAPDITPDNMSPDELSFLSGLAAEWKSKKMINCTGCSYCMPCPQGVDIPGCFSIYNYRHSANADAEEISGSNYKALSDKNNSAVNCAECGACEKACPQHIPVITTLKLLHNELAEKI